MKLIIATHNKHKIAEISNVISNPAIKVESLLDYPDIVLPKETGTTFLENARAKARTVYECLKKSPHPPFLGSGPFVATTNKPLASSVLAGGDLTPRGQGGITPTHQRTNALTNQWILADDSGLEVDALGGRPGVYSSRYCGDPGNYEMNNRKLMWELIGTQWEDRTAHFICSMVLIGPDGREIEIEGRVDGLIDIIPEGEGGFGYDPLFYLPDRRCTIAELSLEEKNKISHRGLAAKKVLEILVEVLGA